MNSKQVNFFLAPDDISAVWHFFMSMGCEIIMKHTPNPGSLLTTTLKEIRILFFRFAFAKRNI
ncbi:hypothetical protein CLV42_1192 [Chitinophaga ginsengisoli]|uniref:Uncharacterized protein n=1 Tax=Chitinophaga ginsengisoli TaxID=363837 RepID=A0A2P8FMP9_9BACT|nr:hypothetical protein CLV42_1192 [Chitinophaga ginsengisoli]